MRKTLLIFTIGIILISCKEKNGNKKNQESEITNNGELLQNISSKIDSLYIIDQKIQIDITKAAQNRENEKVKLLIPQQRIIFDRHIPFLKDIYNKIGYPTIELVGKESSSKFFTMVQHSDSDVKFQEDMLEKVTKEMKTGNVSSKDYAFLTDRVQLAQNKPQIYGTQTGFNSVGQAFSRDLMDSLNVNKRRKEIGLNPIEEYLNESTKMHFQMNKSHLESKGIKEPKLYIVE